MSDPFLVALRRHVAQFDNQYEAAASLGITASYLSLLLGGKRVASDRMLRVLGLTRTVRRMTPAEREGSTATK